MVVQNVVVTCKNGLHAKQASDFVQEANHYKCEVSVEADGRCINAKSLLGVLSLGIFEDSEMTIITNGPDEETAARSLSAIVCKNA